jgi:type IV fimbrial biogenesis protein FimT
MVRKRDRIVKNCSGFSITELVVVMSVVAILSLIAIPAFSKWIPNYRLTAAARNLYSNLQRAKLTAIKKSGICAVTFYQSVDGKSYDYVVYLDDGNLEYDGGEEVIAKVQLADDVRFDTTQGGGLGVSFPLNAGSSPALGFDFNGLTRDTVGNLVAGTIFLKNTQGRTAQVFVSLAGGIKI